MQALWDDPDRGKFFNEVRKYYGENVAMQEVRTYLCRLEGKGYVEKEKCLSRYLFFPTMTRGEYLLGVAADIGIPSGREAVKEMERALRE